MTKIKDSLSGIKSAASSALSEFGIEVTRVAGGISVIISGAVGIFELHDTHIGITTHKARVSVLGAGLALSVLEGRVAEIRGRVEDIQLKYGKI